MTQTIRTIPAPDIFGDGPKFEAALTSTEADGKHPCVTCGRAIVSSGGRVITVTDGGSSLLHPDDDHGDAVDDPGYMGSFAIGPNCARRLEIPAEFLGPFDWYKEND